MSADNCIGKFSWNPFQGQPKVIRRQIKPTLSYFWDNKVMAGETSKMWSYLTVLGAAIIHLSFGYGQTIGNMNPYLINYMNISAGQTVWIQAVITCSTAVAMPLGGLLTKQIGFRIVVVVGSAICRLVSLFISKIYAFISQWRHSIVYIISSQRTWPILGNICSNVWNWNGTSVFCDLLIGIWGKLESNYFTCFEQWFPAHRGVITGLILGGLGIGGIVFTPMQTALINPNNRPYNE